MTRLARNQSVMCCELAHRASERENRAGLPASGQSSVHSQSGCARSSGTMRSIQVRQQPAKRIRKLESGSLEIRNLKFEIRSSIHASAGGLRVQKTRDFYCLSLISDF